MENQFHAILAKIENFAEKVGKGINSRIGKIFMYTTFALAVIFFGILTFSSKFVRSLFGIKG